MSTPYTWQQALTAVLISGILFVILSFSPLRAKVLKEVPKSLQIAVCVGIGLMIAYIGLLNSGVVHLESFQPSLGSITRGSGLMAVLGIAVMAILLALRFRFAILLGIIITTIIGIPLGVTNTKPLADGIITMPPAFSSLLFQFDFSILRSYDFWSIIISLLFMEVVDGLAGFLGLFSVMGNDASKWQPEKIGKAFIADSMGVVIGSCFGLSPNTTYAESGAGVASGGRTGLTALVVAICFALALFFYNIFSIVSFSAIAPALVLVGLFMMSSVSKIKFDDITEAFPAMVVIVIIALTWRISNALSLGWLLYIVMKTLAGRKNELSLTVWIVGLLFAIKLFV
jgi:AGZA family xanthine/uracil permease-like MFS transporter